MPQADDDGEIAVVEVVAALVRREQVGGKADSFASAGLAQGIEEHPVLAGERVEPLVLRVTRRLESAVGGLRLGDAAAGAECRHTDAETGEERPTGCVFTHGTHLQGNALAYRTAGTRPNGNMPQVSGLDVAHEVAALRRDLPLESPLMGEMMRHTLPLVALTVWVLTCIGLVGTGAGVRAAEPNWHITATVAESCSCSVSCSCNFGGDPNRMPCEGNRLIAIRSGHFEQVDLSGVSFLVTFGMRNWSKIQISDRISDQQMAALEKLMPIAFAGFQRGLLSTTKAPITMQLTGDRVTFSTPTSAVEMEVMKGFGGKPVQIMNLPNPAYQGYTQFKSTVHRHTGDDHPFTYSGTNGFTSTMDVGSDQSK